MERIQIIAISVSILLLVFICRLILKAKLREEYAIIWFTCTLGLVIFSFWRNGLEILSNIFGVYEAPNLVFTTAIFAILIYLLHLSVVNSKLQHNVKKLAQDMALLQQQLTVLQSATKDEEVDKAPKNKANA